MQLPMAGQAMTQNPVFPAPFGVAFGDDALKAVHLGPHLKVITAETTAPDEQSLEAFARSQGLDETAVQWLMGTAPAMMPPAVPGQVSGLASQGGPFGVADAASPLPQATSLNTLGMPPEATAPDSAASLPGEPMKTGAGLKTDTPALPSSLNSAALWAMSQATEKARVTSPTAEASPDATKMTFQMMPPPPPAAIWMLRHGLAPSPTKENVSTKGGVALSELDLSEAARPELLESLSQSMAEGGASATPGAAPTPLSGHGSHRLDPAAAARQDGQNPDASASAPDAALAQRSENVQNLAEKMGQAVGQRILSEIEKGQWHLKLSLRPATLGHIEVEMRMRSGELDAVFTAPQALTRELLQDGMAKLKETLNQMGMDVASMQVGDGQTRQRGGESTPGQMSKSTNTGVNASESTTTPAVNAPRMKMGQDGWDVLV
ncbi:flagellar hook-length control protein FliK [Limnohabitans sp. Hippo3]|uniref:flagellar hook-length control protein FliK n=1 Tax=Limnohabitans sp. Hippo3 TaxID=1597956 RepID=UPI001E503254|nr:flagellar hook-length control protein FliK [Limnohabitans sp. Hippo3]